MKLSGWYRQSRIERFRGILELILGRLAPPLERRRLDRMVGPVGVWDALQRYQFGCLRRMGLEPHHYLLDMGCGPLQGGIAFIAYLEPGRYVGIDIRDECIAEAHRQVTRAGLHGKNPVLTVSRTFGERELNGLSFDFVWASQLLYHLDVPDMASCFEQIAKRITTDGRIIGDVKVASGPAARVKAQWRGFPIYYRPLAFFEELARAHGLRMVRHGALRDHGYPTQGTYGLENNELLEFHKC